jgi:hypothetical protein
MRTTAILLVALLLAMAPSFGGEKKDAVPKDAAELLEWLPGTIWEIHSTIKHPAGEGYLMFRDDGVVLKLDADGNLGESRIWGVARDLRVLWGRGNMRVMVFKKEFSEFVDDMYGTSGKRIDDPEIRRKFERLRPGKPKVSA